MQGGDVGGEATGESLGNKAGKDAPEGVCAGGAVRQPEVLFKPCAPELAEAGEVVEAFQAADHGGQGDEEDLPEIMQLGFADAGIHEGFECFHPWRDSPGIFLVACRCVSLFASHSNRINPNGR